MALADLEPVRVTSPSEAFCTLCRTAVPLRVVGTAIPNVVVWSGVVWDGDGVRITQDGLIVHVCGSGERCPISLAEIVGRDLPPRRPRAVQ